MAREVKAKAAPAGVPVIAIEFPTPMSFQVVRDYFTSVLVCTTEPEAEVERIMNAQRPARAWTIDPVLSLVQHLTLPEMANDPPEPGQCERWRERHRHYWLKGAAR